MIKTNEILEKLDTTGNDQAPFTFVRLRIMKFQEMLRIDQDIYLNKIKKSPNEAEFSKFSFQRMILSWHANTRPDLKFEISQKAQASSSHA